MNKTEFTHEKIDKFLDINNTFLEACVQHKLTFWETEILLEYIAQSVRNLVLKRAKEKANK